MDGVTADSFNFRPRLQTSKKSARKRLPTAVKAKLEASQPTVTEAKVPINQQLDLLRSYRIHVDPKLADCKYYEQLSTALGAHVIQRPQDGISVLVHGPRDSKGKVSKLAQNAMDNHVHVVTPLWLKKCYVSQIIQDPHLFPCDYKEDAGLTKPATQLDDNPFGIPLDVLETFVSQPTTPPPPQNIPTTTREESPEPQVRGTEAKETTPSASTERQRTPKDPVTETVKIRELLARKRKEKEETVKSDGNKKLKKDGSLTLYFPTSNKMSIRYGETRDSN